MHKFVIDVGRSAASPLYMAEPEVVSYTNSQYIGLPYVTPCENHSCAFSYVNEDPSLIEGLA